MTLPAVPQGGMFICRPSRIFYQNGSRQGFTLMSDLHIGARNVDYGLIKHELEHAKQMKDRVMINGDVFDMILIQDKKRFRADVLHPRLSGKADLVNAAVEWGVEILGPYADNLDMIGLGNHEEAVARFHGVDVLKILVYELRKLRKNKSHVIHYGGYTGFVDYRFRWSGNADDNKAHGKRFIFYYHHGSGGAAPITKGMIDFARKAWANADILWLGHKHNRLSSTVQTVSCPQQGYEPVVKDVRHLMTGSYFDTYKGQTQESLEEDGRLTNYAADWGVAPQGKGGVRVELTFEGFHGGYSVKVIQ